MMQRVIPWLDEGGPLGGAFRHAQEWAKRLGRPVHALSGEAGAGGDRVERACAESCARLGLQWDLTRLTSAGLGGVAKILTEHDLFVFSQALPAERKRAFFRLGSRESGPATLVCPPACAGGARLLFVQRDCQPCDLALRAVMGLCQSLEARLIVLTIGRSEREAWRQQRLAKETVERHRFPAEFDFLVGFRLPSAVAHVAQWRRCTHVVVERRRASIWQRWLDGDAEEHLLGLADGLTMLTLPTMTDADCFEPAPGARQHTPAPGALWFRPAPGSACDVTEANHRAIPIEDEVCRGRA